MTTSFSCALRSLSIVLALALCACGSDQPSGDTPPPEAEPTTHASNDAVPGSYDDWCGEHQVPESLCTRCNPDLIPAFRATGDWCEEHGLPESQCLLCNPGLRIERPAQAGTAAP